MGGRKGRMKFMLQQREFVWLAMVSCFCWGGLSLFTQMPRPRSAVPTAGVSRIRLRPQ